MIFQDQLQRKIKIEKSPLRIVSLVPSQTELLVELGLEDYIVGVTKFCVHPPHIRKNKTVVGGTKQVHIKKIQNLNPDIILCNKEENTPKMVRELEKIAQVHISDIIKIEDALEMISDYGSIFSKEAKAGEIIQYIKKEMELLKSPLLPKLKIAYFIWREPWMLAGRNTFINTLMELNGWQNVVRDKNSRYPEIKLGQLKILQPEVVFLSTEPFPFKIKHKKEIREHFEGKIELVDGEYFSWYGSRLVPAMKYFREFQTKLSNSL